MTFFRVLTFLMFLKIPRLTYLNTEKLALIKSRQHNPVAQEFYDKLIHF